MVGRSEAATTAALDAARIARWTALHRAACIALLVLAAHLQTPFDSSPTLQLQLDATPPTSSPRILKRLASPFLRWDTLHFLGIASPRPLPASDVLHASTAYALQANRSASGLRLEHSLAFQPAILWMLRLAGYRPLQAFMWSAGGDAMTWDPAQAVLLVSILAAAVSSFSPALLYWLTLHYTRHQLAARLTAYLSILSTSPATLITPTPEPFFSTLALLGLLLLAPHAGEDRVHRSPWRQRLGAATCFACATAFRANGTLLAGFLVWSTLWEGRRRGAVQMATKIFAAATLVLISISPFLFAQVWAFSRFCSRPETKRAWCESRLPSVYAFVQQEYWGVGPFQYWTPAQLPNWLLASPVLASAGLWVARFYCSEPAFACAQTLGPLSRFLPRPLRTLSRHNIPPSNSNAAALLASRSPSLLPHAHFTAATLIVLLVSSHVQIALRFASPGGLPGAWWGACQVLLAACPGHDPMQTVRPVVSGLVLWNVASIVLYAGFYPPA